ncbi:MAG: 3D domain-containing protein [Aeriscardovia sp.]|nr:3D domain-containing protein [Aeriscardovia sp.]
MRQLIYMLAIVVTLNCTAYCDRGITASGEYVREGICAVDRINGVLVSFNTKIILPNGKVLIVKDRFGANHNNHLDIWMASEDECWQFGRRDLLCRIEVE